jgi:hypothetical protein
MPRTTRPSTILASLLPLLAVAALAGCGGGDGAVSDIASLDTNAGDDSDDDSDAGTDTTEAPDGTDEPGSTDPDDADSEPGGDDEAGPDGPATGGGMVVMGRSANSDDPEVQDAQVRYSRCMREHGIDMPDPGAGEQMRIEIDDPAAWEEAEVECRPILEEIVGTFEPPSEEEQARMRDQALEFAKCMREHGIDMPDPQFSEDGGMTINVDSEDGEPAGPFREDDDFQAAAEECGAGEGGMLFNADSASEDD